MPRKISNRWNYKKSKPKKSISIDYILGAKLILVVVFTTIFAMGLKNIKKPNIDFGATFFRKGESAVSSTRTSELDLPPDWKIINKEEGEVMLKTEKSGDYQIIPSILFVKLDNQVKKIDEAYINKLKQGAKKVIPKLEFEKTVTSQIEPFTRYEFKGEYVTRGKKITLTQVVFKNNQDAYLYTISSEKGQLEDGEIAKVNKRVEDWFINK